MADYSSVNYTPSLLAGLIFDETGERLTPTHANKKGTRYRYYVSGSSVRGNATDSAWRLPASDLEELIEHRIATFLSDEEAIYEFLQEHEAVASERQRLVSASTDLAAGISGLGTKARRKTFRSLISRVVVSSEGVDLYLDGNAVVPAIKSNDEAAKSQATSNEVLEVHFHIPAKLRRVGKGKAFVINGRAINDRKPDASLLRLIAQAHRYRDLMLAGDGRAMGEIADEVGVGRSYFSRVVRLGFLSPKIVNSIIAEEQPSNLTAKQLSLGIELPTDWNDQQRSLGII